jgi:hypothetical protein
MQTILKRGSAASRVRSAGLSVAIVAGASIVATFSFFVPNSALAACGASHSAGVHTASANTGAHTATSIAAPSGASSGGGGSLGCANGSSATRLRGLPTAASGRVAEGGAHAARPATHARTAPTRATNATAHLHTVRPAHRG